MEDEQQQDDGYEGARWLAGFVNAYAANIECISGQERDVLIREFQNNFLTALLNDEDGLIRLINPAYYQELMVLRAEEQRIRLAEREANVLVRVGR